ncbi:SpoIIE family protein phosphatase [Streptomyces sp. SD31]|uniref:SpoIIE family protein phosphatase n=1 Tax=Streptomyces sp. SD31 TaxID=3452208 RepID=UPI003F8A729B
MPPLGLEDLMPAVSVAPESHAFEPGDRLLLYTDGVVEALDNRGKFFPLPEVMEAVDAATPRQFRDELHQRLIGHTRDFLDRVPEGVREGAPLAHSPEQGHVR